MSSQLKIANNVIDKKCLIKLGIHPDRIAVAPQPFSMIGGRACQAQTYRYNTLEEFTSSELFTVTLQCGVFVIYEQAPVVDFGIDLGESIDVPNYILRMFG